MKANTKKSAFSKYVCMYSCLLQSSPSCTAQYNVDLHLNDRAEQVRFSKVVLRFQRSTFLFLESAPRNAAVKQLFLYIIPYYQKTDVRILNSSNVQKFIPYQYRTAWVMTILWVSKKQLIQSNKPHQKA